MDDHGRDIPDQNVGPWDAVGGRFGEPETIVKPAPAMRLPRQNIVAQILVSCMAMALAFVLTLVLVFITSWMQIPGAQAVGFLWPFFAAYIAVSITRRTLR